MSIQNYLNQIKNAVFGKDVRQSIHDAIKQCYDDASIDHDNANMEVKLARGSHDTLNERFTSVEENIKNNSEQLDTMENKIVGRINIHQYLFLVNNNDWTLAIQTANNNSKQGEEIYFPFMETNYIVSDTLLKKNGVNWVGESERTTIELKADNKTLLVSNKSENSETSFNSSTIKNLRFIGMGKTFNQIGLNLKGYKSRLENVEIRGFKQNLILSGVSIDFIKGGLLESDISLEIRKNDDSNVNGFSTMLNFESVDISKNNLGIKCKNYNDFTLVGFNLKSCIFGNNKKAFDFDDIKEGKISYCWFEGNETKATLNKYRWVLENNHHHEENDEFNFKLDNNYNGISELKGSAFSCKELKLSKAYNEDIIEQSIEIDNDAELTAGGNKILITNSANNKMYYILINEKNSTDDALNSFNISTNINSSKLIIEKISRGNYKITLAKNLRFSTLNVNCFNCYKEANAPLTTVKLSNSTDDSDFRDYFNWNIINIIAKDPSNMENVNAKICITVNTSQDLS